LALRPQRPQSRAEQLAERQSAERDVFMREVDDELRRDEMTGLFRRFGIPVAALVLAGLLGLGGWLWWQHSRTQAMAAHAEEMVRALDRVEAGHLDAANKELTPLVADAKDGSGAVARLMQAGIAIQQNRREEAIRIFAEVSEDASAPKPLRDLATIRQVTTAFDAMEPQAVIDKLKPLAVPGNPWFGSAGELVGLAYLKQGRQDLAGPVFAGIARDKQAPESLRRRARQMAGVLGVDAIDDAESVAGVADAQVAAPDAGVAQ